MRTLTLALLLSAASLASGALSADAPAGTLDLARYQGKVVYLDFWASWCGPCRRSFPWMNAMEQKYAAQGLVIVSVNVDEKQADADAFLKSNPASFPVVFDPEGKLAAQYQLIGMPSSFIIGRDGKLLKAHQGFLEDSPVRYESELRAALGVP